VSSRHRAAPATGAAPRTRTSSFLAALFALEWLVLAIGQRHREAWALENFFETLIRIHRASEGEGFTGLKPARSADPAIAAADRALADGNIDPLAEGSLLYVFAVAE
jgi:Family of unknown function (DUF6448)